MSESTQGSLEPNPSTHLSHPFRAFIAIVLFLLWLAIILPVFFFYQLVNRKNLSQFYLFFHRGVCRIFSIRCHIQGEISTYRPTLFLANHVSYLDVIILGGYLPGHFIAKSDVAHWPVLGFLASLQNTLFFERRGQRVKEQLEIMAKHFDEKKNLILFPEGTSTAGNSIHPFKSSLLHSVEIAKEEVQIQPVTIAYTHHKNKKMDQNVRDCFAWYGTMPFGSHFLCAAGMGRADVTLIFHPPVSLSDFEMRKNCASYCQEQVDKGLRAVLLEE